VRQDESDRVRRSPYEGGKRATLLTPLFRCHRSHSVRDIDIASASFRLDFVHAIEAA
jgi:hypothetical protein